MVPLQVDVQMYEGGTKSYSLVFGGKAFKTLLSLTVLRGQQRPSKRKSLIVL